LTEREDWLVDVIATGVAWYLAETFQPLSDVATVKKCIVARVEMIAGMERDGDMSLASERTAAASAKA